MTTSNAPQYGKGSKPRPFSIKYTEFDQRWNAIFNKKQKKPKISHPAKTLPEP